LRADFGRIVVEGDSSIQDSVTIHSNALGDTIIKRGCTIGHGAVIHGCVIGENTLVGILSIILDEAHIGPENLVAAASLVKSNTVTPARSMLSGRPARVVRTFAEDEITWKNNGAGEYQRLAREALAHELLLSTVLPLAGLTILALCMAWWGVKHALRPLKTIGMNLAAREPGDLRPLSLPAPAEIRPMIEAINGFMQRLNANIEGLRAFIGDAAHQIRTPLATAYMQTQMTLDEQDPEYMRRGLVVAERNLSRLTRLVNQLLSDAMVMHRTANRNFERLDLQQVIRHALRDTVPKSSKIEVNYTGLSHPAPFYGDAVLLGEAIKNLIDNAIRHGSPEADILGATIDVILKHDETGYRLEACDRGPGISPDQQQRLFQRFERGDTHAHGAGLGMAIIKRVIENHGGHIELEPREGGGLRVCLILGSPR